MRRRIFATITLGLAAIGIANPARAVAQGEPPYGVYVIFDGSGSMWQQLADDSYKIHVAREVVSDFVGRDFGDSELAFRSYGHRREGDCADTELIADFGPATTVAERIRAFVAAVNPIGRTPITRSLAAALEDFGDRRGEIILISDGIETCDPPPCELMRQWQEDGIPIRVHVVGFGIEEEERASLACIAETTGAEYRGADTASELETGLGEIIEVAGSTGLRLVGRGPDGRSVRVQGVLSQPGGPRIEVDSNGRNRVDAGTYTLLVGVRTVNGELFEPVEIPDISVSGVVDTTVEVEVVLPPRVWARFTDDVEERRGANITAFQNGAEAFGFRWFDTVFVDPGTYEFRSTPNDDNELAVTETVRAGTGTEVLFEMARTVYAHLTAVASSDAIPIRQHVQLWQDGERRYTVHRSNGGQVLPGTYTARVEDRIYSWEWPDVSIARDGETRLTLEVPTGTVTFRYFEADGSVAPQKRAFVSAAGIRTRQFVYSEDTHAYPAGSYEVSGFPDADSYGGAITFEVVVGRHTVVELRPR